DVSLPEGCYTISVLIKGSDGCYRWCCTKVCVERPGNCIRIKGVEPGVEGGQVVTLELEDMYDLPAGEDEYEWTIYEPEGMAAAGKKRSRGVFIKTDPLGEGKCYWICVKRWDSERRCWTLCCIKLCVDDPTECGNEIGPLTVEEGGGLGYETAESGTEVLNWFTDAGQVFGAGQNMGVVDLEGSPRYCYVVYKYCPEEGPFDTFGEGGCCWKICCKRIPRSPCTDPEELECEGFENYNAGDKISDHDNWEVLNAGDESCLVGEESIGNKYLSIKRNNGIDCSAKYGFEEQSGNTMISVCYRVSIPSESGLQSQLLDKGSDAVFINFRTENGKSEVNLDTGFMEVDYPIDTWFLVEVVLDRNTKDVTVLINNSFVYELASTGLDGLDTIWFDTQLTRDNKEVKVDDICLKACGEEGDSYKPYCDKMTVLYQDDFSTYKSYDFNNGTKGDLISEILPQWWSTYPPVGLDTLDGYIGSHFVNSWPDTPYIHGNGNEVEASDFTLKLGNQQQGIYRIGFTLITEFMGDGMGSFVPFDGRIAIQNEEGDSSNIGYRIAFGPKEYPAKLLNANGQVVSNLKGLVDKGGVSPHDVILEFDLDKDSFQIIIDNKLEGAFPYPGALGGIRFYTPIPFNGGSISLDDVVFASCTECIKPIADFRIELINDTLARLINLSENGTRFLWNFPDGSTSELSDPVVVRMEGDICLTVYNNCDSVQICKRSEAVPNLKEVIIKIDDFCGVTGDTIFVPVRVAGFRSITGLSFTVGSEEDDVLMILNGPFRNLNTSLGVTTSDIIYYSDNSVDFVWSETNPMNLVDESVLFEIPILIVGQTGTKGLVQPTDSRAFDNTSSSQFRMIEIAGEICVESKLSISGKVYVEHGKPMREVLIDLSGDLSGDMLTDNEGTYSLKEIPSGTNITLTPKKMGSFRDGINVLDLAKVKRYNRSRQREGLTNPYQVLAANVVRDLDDNKITVADESEIQRLILFDIDRFSEYDSPWLFVASDFKFSNDQEPSSQPWPDNRTYNELKSSITTADFVGFKIGDVDGSAVYGQKNSRNIEDVVKIKYDLLDLGSGSYNLRIIATDNFNFNGVQFGLDVQNPIEVIDIRSNYMDYLTTDNIGQKMVKNGQLLFIWADEDGKNLHLDKGEILFDLKFTSDHIMNPDIFLRSTIIDNIAVNEIEEKFQIEIQPVTKESAFKVRPLWPNPFTSEASLLVEINNNDFVRFQVFDPIGQCLIDKQISLHKGKNILKLQSHELRGEGLYYYHLSSSEAVYTNSFIFLR
ncbi:MAG: T9SS type A sorting domain-containing protein, partial [Saprospiraceae bacterium]|nr:T9SS type A sorting domain-containing protein [Saprospiraceae bacterium]